MLTSCTEVCIYTNPKTGYVLESCIYYSLT